MNHNIAPFFFLGTASLLLITSCTPKDSQRDPHAEMRLIPPALETLAESDELLLASLHVKLEPNRLFIAKAPQTGKLFLNIESSQLSVEQDFTWGVLEPEALKTEEESLELWHEQLETRQKLETELELPLQRLQTEKKLAEASRSLKMWEMVQGDKERGQRAMELLGVDLGSGDPAEMERLKWEVELLKTQLQYLQSERPVSDIELQSRKIEWEQRRLDFLKRKEQAEIHAPFSGELRLLVHPQENRKDIWVQSGEEIAQLRDLSSAILKLKPDSFPWASAPFSELLLKVRIQGLPELIALPLREETQTHLNQQERVWVFQLHTDNISIKDLPLGAPVSVQLIQNLPTPSKIISKTALVFSSQIVSDHWADLLHSIYPGSHWVATGQTEIAFESY